MPTTVRIPELPPLTEGLDLSFSDNMPIWVEAENKTRKVTLQALYTFFQTGGDGGTHAPVEYGGRMIYRVPMDVPPGTTTVAIPSLAGLDFSLTRSGQPLLPQVDPDDPDPEAEYEILNAGGFKLLQDGDELAPGERFELFIFSLIAQSPGPSPNPGTTSGSFIKGRKIIAVNTIIDVEQDLNKLLQIRAGANYITLTLPDVEDVPENSCIFIESNINNSKPAAIATTGGQFIYFKNASKALVYMHPGEVLWLFRDADGWYVLNDFHLVYRGIGKPFAAYKVDNNDNEILCKGQEVLRADFPRLWEYANSTSSVVTETTWQTASVSVAGRTVPFPFRGCFSSGNGTTTFRIPDLMNQFLRGIKSDTGSDTERHQNKTGIVQLHEVLSHNHDVTKDYKTWESDDANDRAVIVPGGDGSKLVSSSYGGVETRPINVGVMWVMKY